eukprot:CAMPEP_0184972332 /NCGR_PEP_ID=MMETSP1098-20130426/4341_1 /TAXON_ID=89044 /ORGANISM="Spumella elongata, Strain CCAP 955/1" /LENGTH=638 /DNA_ID=CAMNT_0027494593 /DNA_START=26 /DNA_END=1942 /DNA_ORIENTATION=+
MNRLFFVSICLFSISLLWAKDPAIKTYHDKTVYTLSKDGKRHVIPDWATFVGLGYDVGEIKTIEDAEMEKIPIGEPASQIVEEKLDDNPMRGCPCVSEDAYQYSLHPAEHKTKLFCFVDNKQSKAFFEKFDPKQLNIEHKLVPPSALQSYTYNQTVPESPEMKGCDITINLIEGSVDISQLNSTTGFDKYVCPEMCLPVPYTELPLSWLLLATSPPLHDDSPKSKLISTRSLTCSMTYAELWRDNELAKHHHGHKNSHHNKTSSSHTEKGAESDQLHAHKAMSIALHAMVRRRFEECNEQHLWPHGAAAVTPRKVHGLIVWIGSRSRYDLLASQIEILRNQSSDPNLRIAGWLSSEDQYACRPGTTLCYELSSSNAYFPMMPSTRMNVASTGWSCAQRRMLRGLQHAMLLYAPTFIIVADDDTYVNIQMLNPGGSLDHYIRNELIHNNHIVGSLTLGKKVTNKGFYWGGAGYLFGKKTIDNLNSHVLHGPETSSDKFRDEGKMRYLSVLKQTIEISHRVCKDCAKVEHTDRFFGEGSDKIIDVVGNYANLTTRVIEVCTNIMSPEHTCYHSDHAMSRCLLYAANGFPQHVDCWGTKIGERGTTVGMCMGTDTCGADHLTCHRFYPHPDNALIAKGQYI